MIETTLEQRIAPLYANRRRAVFACFLAQNLAMGIGFGSFGPLLSANRAHFDISLSAAALGMSMLTLALGLLSPIAGRLMQGARVRNVMLAGAVLSATGYASLALTGHYVIALISYMLVGAGVCLMAVLGPVTLVTRSFASDRGKVLSFVNLPVVLFACPFLVATVLPNIGRTALLLGIAALFVLLIPVLLWHVTEPQPVVAAPTGMQSRAQAGATQLLRSPAFWLVSFGIGIMAGAGTAFVVYLVPLGMNGGMTLAAASGLLSIYAGAGLLGTPLFGWLADRIGPPAALLLSVVCQAFLCMMIVGAEGLALYVLAAALGVCCNPVTTLHGVALGALFGATKVTQAMGYSYVVKLPFLFGTAPAVGALVDLTGGYRISFLVCAAALTVSAAFFLALWWQYRSRAT